MVFSINNEKSIRNSDTKNTKLSPIFSSSVDNSKVLQQFPHDITGQTKSIRIHNQRTEIEHRINN